MPGLRLVTILFVIIMDRISRLSHGGGAKRLCELWVASLLFADDDVVLMAPSVQDLQPSMDRFAVKCMVAERELYYVVTFYKTQRA